MATKKKPTKSKSKTKSKPKTVAKSKSKSKSKIKPKKSKIAPEINSKPAKQVTSVKPTPPPEVRAVADDGTWLGAPETDLTNESLDERTRARIARQARKQKQEQRLPSNINITSIKTPSKPKDPEPTLIVPTTETQVQLDSEKPKEAHPRVDVEIPELLKYKLLVHEEDYNKIIKSIQDKLKDKYEELLFTELKETIKQDEKCKQAEREKNLCVNELLDAIAPNLPEGYAASLIQTREGKVQCEYKPSEVGKRLAT